LHEIEPSFGPGRSQPIASMVGELMAPKRPSCGPFLLAIDGRSSNGKSTLAERIAAVMSGSSVVHTDDVAWWQSRFGWNDLLISGVIEPLRHEEAVDYRPPAWDARDRPDSIASPAEAALVVIEGVDSGRSSLAQRVDAVIWVQADLDVTERRTRERVEAGEIDQAGYHGWMSEEKPPGPRADLGVRRSDRVGCLRRRRGL